MSEQDTKERILAAAEAEFLAHGYDRSRTQRIADRAQVNKAMLHYHFKSKDELFAQIFKKKAALLFPKVELSLQSSPSFVDAMCGLADVYIGHLREHPYLPFFLIQVAVNQVELLEMVKLNFAQKLVGAFEAAAERGEIPDLDAHQFVVSFISMCIMPFIGKNLIKEVLSFDEEQFEEFLDARSDEIKRYLRRLLVPDGAQRSGR